MTLLLKPAALQGPVAVPPSKSILHRELICTYLAQGRILPITGGEDAERTAVALQGLAEGATTIDCGMSGATLRMVLPLAMALGRTGVTFTGAPRLMERPVPGDLPMERTPSGWRITGPLTAGSYELPADVTSQVLSGLLLALPLLDKPSNIMLTTKAVSRPYLAMTRAVMAHHGVRVEETADGYRVPAPQTYAPATLLEEGDWSAAAWYAVVNGCQSGPAVTVANCPLPSLQGDSRVIDYVNQMPAELSLSDTPDLLPPLALYAALQAGKTTRFTGCAALRHKESDRLTATAEILNALGGRVTAEPDGLTVKGVAQLRGGATVDSRGDHRMAMLAAFGALFCARPVTLTGGECVAKSYANFWRDYRALGGAAEEASL